MTDPDVYDGDDLDNEDTPDERTVTLDRSKIRSLERDAKRARKADEELAAIKRENAFIKAGINPDTDPKLKYFMNGYDGEVTAEAIKTAAEAAGFLTPTPSAEQQTEADATDRISQASAGATSRPPDTKTTKVEELQEAARTGGREAVLAKIREHGHNVIT